MRTLKVYIEANAVQTYVGDITYQSIDDATFSYAPSYMDNPNAVAISLSMPLQDAPFSPIQTRNFFEGLLPEGFTRRSVAGWLHVSENDYLSILAGLGRECLGAIKIVADNQLDEVVTAYEKLTDDMVKELAGEGAVKAADFVIKSHLSLTGASGKVGLYYDEQTSNWFLPIGDAPSTHIVKQSHVRLEGIVTNEQLCLLTAKKLGIEVPESFIINTDKADDEMVLFATKRYDRVYDNGGLISGMKKPLRLHQEDFAQALGIAAVNKYENVKQYYLKKIFYLLAAQSANPIEDQLKLWDILIFDFLVGNTDNHIKNISLIYDKNLKSVRLAPAYDIVSTAVYSSCTRDMGMFIGDDLNLDDITEQSFVKAAGEIGLGTNMAMEHFHKMCMRFEQALCLSAGELTKLGFRKADELCKQILTCGGIAGMK